MQHVMIQDANMCAAANQPKSEKCESVVGGKWGAQDDYQDAKHVCSSQPTWVQLGENGVQHIMIQGANMCAATEDETVMRQEASTNSKPIQTSILGERWQYNWVQGLLTKVCLLDVSPQQRACLHQKDVEASAVL